MNYPQIKPTLNLDFSNTKTLDPRINFRRGTPGAYYDGKTYAKAEENLIANSTVLSDSVPWNGASSSNDNSGWNFINTTVHDNQPSPDGTNTAYKVSPTDSSTTSAIWPGVSKGTEAHTFSVYVKMDSPDYTAIALYWNSSGATHARFNLVTGQVTLNQGSGRIQASMHDVGGGWWRCVATHSNRSSTSATMYVLVDDTNAGDFTRWNQTDGPDGAKGLLVWHPQIEARDSVTSYIKTDGTPKTKYQPQLMFASPDQPRFDHDVLTGESKGLLIEESRTNLIEYSEDFYLSPWRKNQNDSIFKYLFVEENSTVSPGGKVDASKVYITQGMPSTGVGFIEIVFTLADNTIYNASIYAKKAEYKMLSFQFNTKDSTYSSISVDLNDGVILNSTDVVGSSIENVGNEWYRVGFSFDSKSGGTTPRMIMQVRDDDNDANLQTNNGIYIWGAQLETGSFPTSYIKTSGASATRSADNASITGENFSSWYRQDEGSLYLNSEIHESRVTSTYEVLSLYMNSSNFISVSNTGRELVGTIYTNSSTQSQFLEEWKSQIPYTINTCVGYKEDSVSLFNKGERVGLEDTSAQIPSAIDKLFIGNRNGSYWSGKLYIKKLSYYPQRLTNEQLQQLTK